MTGDDVRSDSPEAEGSGSGRSLSRAYDAYLTFEPGVDVHERVAEQLVVWLGEKGIDVDTGATVSVAHSKGDLAVIHHTTAHSRDMLARLTESSPTGLWRTHVALHAPASEAGWIRIKVTNDQGKFVDVPRVATYIMDVLDTFDGPAMFTSEPRIFGVDHCDDLLDIVCDPDRRTPVFVAGSSDGLPFDAYVKKIRTWTKQVRGMGHVIVLDPHATLRFQGMVGDAHAAGSGTIRTYLPELDPASAIDARRHKILGTRRLVDQSDSDTRLLLGRIVRGLAADRSFPASVSRVERALRRTEDSYLVSAIAGPAQTHDAAPFESTAEAERMAAVEAAVSEGVDTSVADLAEIYLTQIESVKTILGVEALDVTTLRDIAGAADRGRVTPMAVERISAVLRQHEMREAQLEDEVSFHRELAEELELDLAIAEAEQSTLADENRWLRERLRRARDYEGATVMLPESATTQYPKSFDELLARAADVAPMGVIVCGDSKTTLDLDALDRLERLVRNAWDALLTMADFLRARENGDCSGGLIAYVDNTPAGYRGVSNGKFSRGETAITMKQHGEERKCPVPLDVSPSGWATMKTHFKLGSVGMASPRLYVLDRSGIDNKVYIGYIGTHLTNTQTN